VSTRLRLYPPKRFFGAARNIEEGGSLTIVAKRNKHTALIETRQPLDEVIFERSRQQATWSSGSTATFRAAYYPSIDVERPSTRHEDLSLRPHQLPQVCEAAPLLGSLGTETKGPRAAHRQDPHDQSTTSSRLDRQGTHARFVPATARRHPTPAIRHVCLH